MPFGYYCKHGPIVSRGVLYNNALRLSGITANDNRVNRFGSDGPSS